jgi:Protein of unknown function (DUF3108)
MNSITRYFFVLALVLTGSVASEMGGAAAQTSSAAHTSAPAQTEAKVSSAVRIEPLRPGFELPNGQTLHYEADWRFVTAGIASFHLERDGSQEHLEGTADSTGVVALLLRVADRFNSYFDAKTLCSYKVIKHTEEGSHRKETMITYEYSRGKAVLEEQSLKDNTQKRVENDIPGCVTDVVSGMLYVASLPLQQGATYSFPLNDGSKTVTVQAHVEGKEQVKTPAGTFNTIRVGPEGEYGPLKNRGRVWIWYTDDAQHLPVQMRARLFWGTLTVYLTSVSK